MCGTTSAQKSALASDQALGTEMRNAYSTDFQEAQDLFTELHSGLDGIVAAGPSQTGMSPAEEAARTSEAINNAAASNQNIQRSIGTNAAKSGVVPGVESGVVQAERSTAATQVENNLSNAEADITKENYQLGRENFEKAVAAEESLPGSTMNPVTSAGNATVGANEATGKQADANQQASDSWMGLVGGLAGSAASQLKFGGGGGRNISQQPLADGTIDY